MRLALVTLALLLLTLPGCGGARVNSPPKPPPNTSATIATASSSVVGPANFAVTSSAFAENTQIPVEYSCKGRNVPPALRWENVPTRTGSLALVVDDPDAPGGLYVHWVVTGIPPSSTEISGAQLPRGASVSLNSSGKAEYLGPCPPPGTGVHHYRFQLYALSKPLTLPATTSAREATQAIADATIAEAYTVGLFSG